MNKDVILAFIKKNLVSLLCGVVALAALISIFYPISGWIEQMQTDATSQAGQISQLKTLMTKNRKLPTTDPTRADAEAMPLKEFPTQTIIDQGTKINESLIAQSKSVIELVDGMNRAGHNLMVADALPAPASQNTLFTFARVYSLVLDSDPNVFGSSDGNNPAVQPNPDLVANKALNLQNDILHGAMPPSKKDWDDAADQLWRQTYEPQIYYKNSEPVNKAEVTDKFMAEKVKIPQRLMESVAKNKKIYVDTKAFELNTNITPKFTPTMPDVWYSQFSFWMQQDLARAIAETNKASASVLDAPIKRLISLQITPPPMLTFPPPAAGQTLPAGSPGMPSPAGETSVIPLTYSLSPTGRASNAMYDVVQFRLLIDVDASKMNEVIESLSHNRLITFYKEDFYQLDTAREATNGYLYAGRVVRLNLEGEMLFLRSWTLPFMPKEIKTNLGLIAATPGMNPGTINPGAMNPGMNGRMAEQH